MSNLDQAEQIYLTHDASFGELERELERAFGIPRQITGDSVKRIILSQLNHEIAPTFLRSMSRPVRAFGLYVATMFYFACFALVGSNRRPVSADVLFEEWGWRNYRDFYRAIHQALPAADVKILSTTSLGVFAEDHIRPLAVIDRGRQLRFDRAIAFKILLSQARRFPLYFRLSKRTGLDFVDLGLRLLRQIATHETDTANLRARFLISASDNHYSALRYFIYRRNGIGNLLLMQNGARVVLHAGYASFIHCDYYIGWSKRRLALFHGMQCPNKLAFGSVRQHRATARIAAGREPRFDVVFIEQIFERPELGDPDHALYLRAVENLRQFALLQPELRILYKGRPDRKITEDRSKTLDVDQLLAGSPVQVDDRDSYTSYEAIADSRLIIACNSSMRVDALSMGRNVLTLNYGRSTCDFLAERPDELGVLVEPDFATFSERVLHLLAGERDPAVVGYFGGKRAGLQGIAEDPALRIAELVASKI